MTKNEPKPERIPIPFDDALRRILSAPIPPEVLKGMLKAEGLYQEQSEAKQEQKEAG